MMDDQWIDARCADCIYCSRAQPQGFVCRRYPPLVTIRIDSVNNGSTSETRYPRVDALPACAEFRMK